VADSNGQKLAYAYFEGRAGPAISGQAAHTRRSAADCGQYRQAAGAIAEGVGRRETAGLRRGPFVIIQRRVALVWRRRIMDRTTKILLTLIAAGLWINVAINVGPRVAYAQNCNSQLNSIVDDLGRIQRGTCTNSKIC